MKFKKPILVVSIVASVLSFFGCDNFPKENNITVNQLHDLMENEDVVILDVRTPKETAQGKIKSNALEADFFEDNFIEEAVSKIPKDKDVYVYCKGGRRSAKAVIKLRELGYAKTHNVEGGIEAWKAEGFSVE
jgi:rhodanese-related sulfurtransferase